LQLRAETTAVVWKPPKQQHAKAADRHQSQLFHAALPGMTSPARASAAADEDETAAVAVHWCNSKPAR
jgi:hypothetical protein